jgi:DnaJ-class molecular chaperone
MWSSKSITFSLSKLTYCLSTSYIKEIENEGMPLSADPTKKGKLIIRFNIIFPKALNEQQKKLVKQVFAV